MLVLVIAIAAVLAVGRLVRFRAASGTLPRPLIESVLLPAALVVASIFVARVGDYQINLTGAVNDTVEKITQGIAYLAAVWGIMRFSGALADHLTFAKSESIDAHLARAAIRIGGIGLALAS